MQMACIEGARNTAGIESASSTEFGDTAEPVVGLITEWMDAAGLAQRRDAAGDLGGTMRLGPTRPALAATASSAPSTGPTRSRNATATVTR
jgi:CTP synthase